MPQHSAHPSPSAHMGAGSPLSTDSMRPPTTPRYSFKGFPEVADLAATHAPLRLCFGSAAHSRPGDSPGVQARNNIIILFQLLCMFEEFFVPEGNECWIWDVIRSEWALDLGLEELTPVRVKLIATVFRASFDVSFYWRHFRAGYREDQPGGSSREPDLEACDELLLQLVSKWIGFRRSHSTKTRRADDRSSEMLRLVSRITQWRSELSEHRDDLLRTQIAAPREVADHIHGDGLGLLCQLLHGRVRNFEAIIGHFIDPGLGQVARIPTVESATKRPADEILEKEPFKRHFGTRGKNRDAGDYCVVDGQDGKLATAEVHRKVSQPRPRARDPGVHANMNPSAAHTAASGETDVNAGTGAIDSLDSLDKLDARIDELEEKVDRIDSENLEYVMSRFRLVDRDIVYTDEQVATLEGNQEELTKELEALKVSHPADLVAVRVQPAFVPQQALREVQSRLDSVESENESLRRAMQRIERQWLKLTAVINGLMLGSASAESPPEDIHAVGED